MKDDGQRGLRRWRTLVAPALLVVLVLPLLVARARLESSLWMDEVYTLQLVHHRPVQLVDLTARDVHPPGYYLALQAWLGLARAAGFGPGTAWVRGLGVALWLALVVAVWGMVRRLAGPRAAGLSTWSVGGAAAIAALAVQARGYALVGAAAVVGFLAALLAERAAAAGRWREAFGWWAGYALAAAGAAWTHLLAAPLFAAIAAAWFALTVARRAPRRGRRVFLGATATLLAALSFLPWLARVPAQLGGLESSGTEWMTPAAGRELARVFVYWLPFGPVGDPELPPLSRLGPLGAMALLAPLSAAALVAARRRAAGPARERLDEEIRATASRVRSPPVAGPLPGGAGRCPGDGAWLLVLALPVAIVFILLLWVLARGGMAPVFHGPRYPLLAAGLWALGLAGLAEVGGGVLGRRRARLGALLLVPWLLAAAIGSGLAFGVEAGGGLPAARPAIEAALADGSAPLYVSPSELAPFFRRSLGGLPLAPVEDVACGLLDEGRAVVLDLNPWRPIDRARERVLARAANRGRLAVAWRWEELPTPALGASLLRLEGAGPRAAELCARRLAPPRPWAGEPAAVALPEEQLYADGWSRLEVGDDLVPRRWGIAPAATLRFDRPLPPGRYVLQLVAHRGRLPRPVEAVCVEPPAGAEAVCAPRPEGRFQIAVPFSSDRRLRRPLASVRHPLWSPAEGRGGRGDRRRLSVMLEAAWIERRER